MTRRPLTIAERRLAQSMFGDAIDFDRVAINRRRWWPFQPRSVVMAPDGEIWCHPAGTAWRDCYATASIDMQALFIHEMTHVWQAQRSGRWWLPLMRHPFCRYDYAIVPGKRFGRYGIEQQAEILAHVFLMRRGVTVPAAASLPVLETLLPFAITP